jgi:signal transduction histidine kinase
LTVSDTGCIPPENSRIFEPFFTTRKSARARAWPREFTASSNNIRLDEVEGFSRETTFRVYLPELLRKRSGSGCPRFRCMANETILVVEDEQPVRELV